ncbi:MAG: putative sulfate exporter family transporter [Deltaproteobacteria bacterium]|nr:putative sulfate exporter family transporter [Deltaproteobacteria bacterium]
MGTAGDPSLFASLGSLEGVPDWFEPRASPAAQGIYTRTLHDALNWLAAAVPGLGLALLLAYVGHWLSGLAGALLAYEKSPISPILLAVVLGLVLRNTVGVPKAYEAGLKLCLKTVLRIGIVLLGLGLSLQAVAQIGLLGLPIIACCIGTALVAVTFINRALGLPKRLGTLIAVGTSICGVSAIVATAPVIEAEENETSYAVACITIFGLLALFTYPILAHRLFSSETQVGLFLGTSIHDTSQVTGAGLSYAQQFASKKAMDTAVVVKLVRNVFMSVLIPLMALLYRRSAQDGRERAPQKWHQVVPLFVVGFVALACLRSVGDLGASTGRQAFGVVDRHAWVGFCKAVGNLAPWFLASAMGAVGLGTGLGKLRGLGWKPFTVGFAAAFLVGCASTVLIKLLVP